MDNKSDIRKLDRWTEKLLDTGKRNNLINFRESKASSAEVVYPDCQRVFSKCSVGHVFEIYDPKISDDYEDFFSEEAPEQHEEEKLNRKEYTEKYSSRIKGDKKILVFAQTPNPITAVKNIAKKSEQMLDETGISVAYLAFGFVRWNEKEGSQFYYRAPLLLVHCRILTGSVLDPVKIEISDDDVVVNPTFDYLLQAEYGLTLPPYEDGETLTEYYGKVAHAVQKMGWQILDECKLGIFSFLKINMYEDLKKNAGKILENSNIQALIGNVQPDMVGLGSKEHVVQNPIIDLHTVVDADSSQIEAIEMAKSGKSFVLQGPPGTGKSQTITNIIAECLHDGKKVLFVSEKQAALNVVYDKLKKEDLADFCLELHSHKANKKAVIEELNRTLETPKSRVSSSAQEEIRQKREAQLSLDTYADALHKKRDVIDKSLYQLYELHAAQRKYPRLEFSIKSIQNKGQNDLLRDVRILEQYAEYVPTIGLNYKNNSWYGFNKANLNYDERNQLREDLQNAEQNYDKLKTTSEEIKAKYQVTAANYNDALQWQSVLSYLAQSDVVTPSILTKEAYDYAVPHVKKMKELSGELVPVRDQLYKAFSEDAVEKVKGEEVHAKLAGDFSSFFSRVFSSEYKSIITSIQPYYKNGGKLKYQDALDGTAQLMKVQTLLEKFNQEEYCVNSCLGACYQGPDTEWDRVLASLEELKTYHAAGISFGKIAGMSVQEFRDAQSFFGEKADELQAGVEAVADARERLSQCFTEEMMDLNRDDYGKCLSKVHGCLSEFDKLGNWLSFSDLLRQLREAELTDYIDVCIQNSLKPEEIPGTYKKAFYEQWIDSVIFTDSDLSSFSRVKQDQAVRSFVEKDNLQYEISKIQIKAELSQKRPDTDLIAGGSAVAVLRREGQKKRKQMPIRKLLSETGSLVQLIKPCFLMSPLSVSTFLDPEKIAFDTVVFDEASQIFPQDAIGAIYRGKQLIVVGDSKQMPPSDFFSSNLERDDEDEETGDITDFESILDICSSVFSTERLAWHYRSHYEQLIAFSNANYYNNNLVTFPSSTQDHEGIGVDYYHVDGVFDRKSKTNRIEAEYIVDLIYKNIEEHPERSLGVVAFSVSQQTLIDRLLSKRRESDPSYEWFFRGDSDEPFFVKNLETVQGDERDTIIFSIAYARDSQGKFYHNFGPLNRIGGERRLNVAVTRAKDNVQIVSSIRYTDINLSSSGSEGVRLLRAYLDYAQNGEEALERSITVSGEDQYDSDFEQEVCEYLRDQGFTVDTQVGCSGYKIDLGIRKPDSSDYVLAVECDGATYHSSKNARDRDSLRQRVLENMGWQFYRIWSTDWFRNTAVEKAYLLTAARDAISRADDPHKNGSRKNWDRRVRNAEKRFSAEIEEPSYTFKEYKEADALGEINRHLLDFQEGVLNILKMEAPLSEEYLLKRIVSCFGREKVTKYVLDEFNSLMYQCQRKGIIRRSGFLYLQGSTDIKLRVPGEKREIK